MGHSWTENDFDHLSWHDCHVWGMELRIGDPTENDWTSDVAFSIDYIVEWLCGVDRSVQFRVAPAKFIFHHVTDLALAVDWGRSGFQVAPAQMSISRITREQVAEQQVQLNRAYYRWRMEFHDVTKGTIELGAAGFTQTLLAEPVLSKRQHLTLRERDRLTGRCS